MKELAKNYEPAEFEDRIYQQWMDKHCFHAETDPTNFLLMHAMGPNVAGVIGTAVAAGTFMAVFGVK